ncbi:MAG: porin [Pseudomonadota bacterium]
MKKLVLCAATAMACTIPMAALAGTTLYGTLSYSLNQIDEDKVGGLDGLSGQDNISLLGVKGSYGDDIKAFFHLQTQARADSEGAEGRAFTQRFFFGGLSGGFGKVAYGRMTNAYKFSGFKMDPFYNLSHIGAGGGFAAGGATYGLSPATNGFTDNALQYFTPSFGGFKVVGGFFTDDSNDDEHGYLIGGEYNNAGIKAGVTFATNGDNATLPNVAADGDALRIYGGYTADNWLAGISYEQVDITSGAGVGAGATKDEVGYLYLTGTYKAKAWNTDLVASIGNVDDGPAEGIGFTLGPFYHITDKTRVYLTYSYADLDNDTKPSVLSLGALHNF